MLLYGYFKEWRKNPKWSFSCCLALFLPLFDIAGEVSGLADTNMVTTQLDTGHMEVTTIAAAVQDSGALEVTIEGRERDDDTMVVMEENSCDDTQFEKAGEVRKIAIVGIMKDSVATHVILQDGERGRGIGPGTRINNKKKCSEGTQTELSAIFSFANVVDQDSAKETGV